jgi:hypothetical protein
MNICADRSIVFLVYSHFVEVSEEKQYGGKSLIRSEVKGNNMFLKERQNRIAFIYFGNTKTLIIHTNCDILVLYVTDSRIKLYC